MNKFLVALVLIGSLFACDNGKQAMGKQSASIETVLGFDLPGYATAAHFFSERGMGLLAYLKCEIPSGKLAAFLQHNPVFPDTAELAEEPVRFAAYNTKSPWWTPVDLQAPRYGVKEGKRGKWRTSSYLAADRRADQVLIYFMYFEEP